MKVEKADIQQYLEEIKNKVAEEVSLEKIIVFGSCARGDINKESDIDLVFIVDDYQSKNIKYKISDLLKDRILPLDIIVLSTIEMERKKNIIGTLPYEIKKEGRVIYER